MIHSWRKDCLFVLIEVVISLSVVSSDQVSITSPLLKVKGRHGEFPDTAIWRRNRSSYSSNRKSQRTTQLLNSYKNAFNSPVGFMRKKRSDELPSSASLSMNAVNDLFAKPRLQSSPESDVVKSPPAVPKVSKLSPTADGAPERRPPYSSHTIELTSPDAPQANAMPPPAFTQVTIPGRTMVADLFGRGLNVNEGQGQPAFVLDHRFDATPAFNNKSSGTASISADEANQQQKQQDPHTEKGCEKQPCRNGAECFSDPTSLRGYTCRCRSGFHGLLCEYDTVECLSGPCLNDAVCRRNVSDQRGYSCDCAVGFVGKTCEQTPINAPSDETAKSGNHLRLAAGQIRQSKFNVGGNIRMTNSMNNVHHVAPAGSTATNRSYVIVLSIVIGIVTFLTLLLVVCCCCCIEMRRNSIIARYLMYQKVGIERKFPVTSSLTIAWRLTMRYLACHCLPSAYHTYGSPEERYNLYQQQQLQQNQPMEPHPPSHLSANQRESLAVRPQHNNTALAAFTPSVTGSDVIAQSSVNAELIEILRQQLVENLPPQRPLLRPVNRTKTSAKETSEQRHQQE